ncbi:MAG: hypothetical protein JRG86_07825 [Deltaproteobacteria bacterium]|jgi:hypothetical protein|nr:hypothetical protein [Deltaproteobacteria bacterium]MBW2497269.1 hypothetical protein [Deltaproteobacteria bacterium]
MILVVGSLVGLIAVSALAIDVGLVWAARTQLQNASDAAALAGAANLINPDIPSVTSTEAVNASIDVASRNGAISLDSLVLPNADVELGNWDLETRSFDPGVNLADPDVVNAVRVATRLDNVANGPVPAFFSRVLGRDGFSVGASAVAYLGYAGGIAPGEVEMPIAIDCCKLKGAECKQDYCETVSTNPPNPCPLDEPQADGITSVSCLQFRTTEDQNACWTELDTGAPSISANNLRQLVEDGNSSQLSTSDQIYVDNGDKASVIKEMNDKFHGDAGYTGQGAGVDRYPPFDGKADSWTTSLPVVACQSDANCATGSAAQLVGFVCFEIREIEESPLNIIRGRFLCDSDPLFDECDIGRTTSGGLDFGIRADVPVLVR